MFCLQATGTDMGARDIAAHRCDVALLLEMLGILLRAGPDGMPLATLARRLYPSRRGQEPYLSTRRLMNSAAGALPIWWDTVDGVVMVSLDPDDYAEAMRGYGMQLRPTWARDDGC